MPNILKKVHLRGGVIAAALLSLSVGVSMAADPGQASTSVSRPLDVNNQWRVNIGNGFKIGPEWFYVTIMRVDNHWEIQGIYDQAPNLDKSLPLELFAATRDLQQWTNAYLEMRTDCNKFEVRESDKHSVCSSSLAEEKTGLGIAGLFFGGSGKTPFAYTNEKVSAAIKSIPTQQALAKLNEFESRSQAGRSSSIH